MSALRAAINELTGAATHISRKGRSWGPTLAAWGGGATLLGLYLTDWKVITGHIPYIKDKYEYQTPR